MHRDSENDGKKFGRPGDLSRTFDRRGNKATKTITEDESKDKEFVNDNLRERLAIGKYGFGERNSNEENLLQFLLDNNLTALNTMFKHPNKHRITWTPSNATVNNFVGSSSVRLGKY